MSTQKISVRLDEEMLDSIDRYAQARRWPRSTVVAAALESYLDDAGRGVPDAPVSRPRQAPAKPAAKVEVSKRELPPGVVRGSDLVRPPVKESGEPNVDRFDKTYEYSAAMALWREGKPWEHLQKERKS